MERQIAVRCTDCCRVVGDCSEDWEGHKAETGHERYTWGMYDLEPRRWWAKS